jgi:hypothetical protein
MMVDSARCPGTGGLAKLTWPHAWCASPAHARDLPGVVPAAPALDTMNAPAADDLRAAHGSLLGVYLGSTERLDPPLFRITDHRARPAMVVFLPAQRRAVHVDGCWCTWMYETRNETGQTPGFQP